MRKEIQEKLVQALRSGQYKQGEFRLKDSDGRFCPLGIIVDIYIKETGSAKWVYSPMAEVYRFESEITKFSVGNNFTHISLPDEVVDWAGVKSRIPHVDNGESIMRLNDEYKKSFIEIADIIENAEIE